MSPPVLGAPQRAGNDPAAVQAPTSAPAPEPQRRDLTEEELVKLPIQALLVRSGVLTIDQLSDALRENVASGIPVEDVVVRRGWVDEAEITRLKEAKVALTPASAPEPPAPQPEPELAPPPAPPQPVAEVPQQPPAQPAPAPPVAQPQPVAPQAPAPEPEPITVYEPPAPAVVPVPAPEPEPQVVLYVPPQQPPAPPAAPLPPTAPVYFDQLDPEAGTVGVFLRLSNGERIWAGRFPTMEAAEQQAQQLIHAVVRPEPGQWLRHGDRFVRPEAVVSVELTRRED